MNPSPSVEATDQLPLGRAIILHLLPGTLTMVTLLVINPALIRVGWPRVLAYQAAVGLVGIPVMLCVVFMHARRTGRSNLWQVIRYTKRPRIWVYPAILAPMLVWSFGLYVANGPLRDYLARDVFAWIPAYLLPDWEPSVPPNRRLLLAALVVQLLVDGLTAPSSRRSTSAASCCRGSASWGHGRRSSTWPCSPFNTGGSHTTGCRFS